MPRVKKKEGKSIVTNNYSDSNIAAGTFILSYVRREDFIDR